MNLQPENDLSRVKADVFWGELTVSEHVVQVYEHEQIFLETLTGFTGAGVNAGDAVIVIATDAHLAALNKRLQSHGLHVGSLIAENRYIPLNAEQTLARFMVNNRPDEQRFIDTISPIIERAGRKNRQIRAFGEMVALLWASGDEAAAIELEEYWNRLRSNISFGLFCAYPLSILKGNPQEAVKKICSCHSHMIGGVVGSVSHIDYRDLKEAV
jgi:hypothetical protein